MIELPQIAIIIPVYNRVRNVSFVLESLYKQTNQNFEIIISDDGSSDGLKQILRKDIKYHYQEDKGNRVSKARNEGVKLADTELGYLFLDSDVVLNPKAIEEYYKLIKKHPDKVILGKYDWVRKSFQVIFDDRKLEDEQVLDDIGGTALTGNLYVPKEAFKKTGGFDEKVVWGGEDCEFGFALHRAGFKGIFSTKVYGVHLPHPQVIRHETWRTIEYMHNVKYPERGKLTKEFIDKLKP